MLLMTFDRHLVVTREGRLVLAQVLHDIVHNSLVSLVNGRRRRTCPSKASLSGLGCRMKAVRIEAVMQTVRR